MKRTLRRGAFGLAAGFVALLGLRLGYGYLSTPEPAPGATVSDLEPATPFELPRSNYASSKLKRAGTEARPATTVDQKYEKVAELRARTTRFDEDEARLRQATATHGGLVQYERRSGLERERVLDLAVGIEPSRFDAFLEAVRGVGELRSARVHKVDKTNDYKELQASRAALEQTRAALASLKGRSGSLDEAIRLEERILEIDERIQRLGVSLGEFDAENEFCTVKISLAEETRRPASGVPLWQRAKVALEWTVRVYLALVATACFGLLAVLLALLAVQRLRVVRESFAALVAPPRGAGS